MSSAIDKIASQQQEEFAKLKSGKKGYLRWVLGAVAILIVCSFIFEIVPGHVKGKEALDRARQELLSSGQPWGRNLNTVQREYRLWLSDHGIGPELRAFDQISQLIFFSASRITQGSGGSDLSLVGNALVSVHFALIRIAFVILACWRLWFIAIMLAAVYRWKNWRVYNGEDILGQMGTGHLFYSGLRAGLEKRSAKGSPDMQVTGLACPRLSSETEADVSTLARILKKYSAYNATNKGLVRVLVAHPNWPSYLEMQDEEHALNQYYAGGSLPEHASFVLERALKLHAHYRSEHGEREPEFLDQHYEGSEVADEKVSSGEYAWMLQQNFHRVLSPEMRKDLAKIGAAEFATILLSHFSGKVMAYGFQGNKWIRRSNFPELCARAILHSIPSLGTEYDFETRAIIRRSLIYSSRKSVFAPLRFPVDLSVEARAARQVVELLMASPHELLPVADEVELIGHMHEMHVKWAQSFFDAALTRSPEIVENSYATVSNLFVIPIDRIVTLARRVIDPGVLARVEALVQLVSQKQQLQNLSPDSNGDPQTERGALHSQGRFSSPLTAQEIRDLGELHGVPAGVLRDWSAVRAMLNHYGWLARRVGDYSVPESSVIFAVVKFDRPTHETNSLGLIGNSGMVALRGSRIENKWGKHWQSRFNQGLSASMSESREDFERLMQGIKDELFDDGFSSTAIGS